MKPNFRIIEPSITAPTGFRAAAVFCDIKKLGTGKGSNKGRKRDLALIVSDVPAVAAGMFTTNQVCAAPVKLCLARLKSSTAQAIVVNSGNANACTGERGLKDAESMATLSAKAIAASRKKSTKINSEARARNEAPLISAEEVLVASTGRIGVFMPMPNVKHGIEAAAALLNDSAENAHHVAEAIMTSDTRPKEVAVELMLDGKKTRIAGICKGAGMIQPGMSANGARPAAAPSPAGLHATMLCFITTDAAIEAKTLQRCLAEAVANSFNRITVDGDMSTNDTVLVLANGLAGNRALKTSAGAGQRTGLSDLARFQEALNYVALELAKKIVRDGEGVSRFVTVRVNGARDFREADAAARSVANSLLVKTSWCGGDPNWGRILDALGYSPAKIVEEKVDVAYSAPGSKKRLYSLRRGKPAPVAFKALCAVAALPEFDLHINLNLGRGQAVMYSSDLTEEYVDFNKGDVTDPTSLGG